MHRTFHFTFIVLCIQSQRNVECFKYVIYVYLFKNLYSNYTYRTRSLHEIINRAKIIRECIVNFKLKLCISARYILFIGVLGTSSSPKELIWMYKWIYKIQSIVIECHRQQKELSQNGYLKTIFLLFYCLPYRMLLKKIVKIYVSSLLQLN